MKTYRRRFIELNMLMVGVVLTVVFVVVGVYMTNTYYNDLRMTMEQVLTPLVRFDKPMENRPVRKDDNRENILTVFYNVDSGEYDVLSFNNLYTNKNLEDILKEIVSSEKDFGTLKEYGLIYYKNFGNPYRIAIVSCDYINVSIIRLVIVLFGIWAMAMLLFLIISIKFSKYASKPMERAIEREKQFVADASHDLKTPLSIILANNAILLENPDPDTKHWLDSNQIAAKRMQELINQMLTLSSVDKRIEFSEIDLSNLAYKVSLEFESLAYEKGIELDTDIVDDCKLVSNEEYVTKIISGLLENAIKYEPKKGRVLLKIDKNQLSVRNFGSHIEKEDTDHIFDRFYRSDKSRQNNGKSFGLGLSITKEMVDKLNGEIKVVSDNEDGTVFFVKFH